MEGFPGRRHVVAAGVLAALAVAWPLIDLGREVHARNGIERVETYAPVLRQVAGESGVDAHLLAGLMFSESSGRPDAVSHKDALGLFQLMLPTARERARRLGLDEPSRRDLLTDPLLNARLAADYLRWLEWRYDGDLEKMLVAYNAGPGRLEGWIEEAGGWEAWRAERRAAGDSDVLRFADKVRRYRDEFARRGRIQPPAR